MGKWASQQIGKSGNRADKGINGQTSYYARASAAAGATDDEGRLKDHVAFLQLLTFYLLDQHIADHLPDTVDGLMDGG